MAVIESQRTIARPRLCAAFCVLTIACHGADSASPPVTVRDSAGVRVVESTAPAWSKDDAWTLSAAPTLQIGVAYGDEALQFDGISGVQRLSDGRLLVGDNGSVQLRIFHPDGRHQMSVGGPGEGPAEMEELTGAYVLRDDSLAGRSTHQVLFFSPQGRIVRKVRPQPPPGERYPNLVEVLDDGTIVGFVFPNLWQIVRGPADDSMTLHRHAPTGEWRGQLARFHRTTLVPAPTSVAGIRTWDQMHLSTFAPFAITTRGTYVAGLDAFEVQVFDSAGRLRQLMRRPWELVAVSDEHRERYAERELGASLEGGAAPSASVIAGRRRRLEEIPFVSHFAPSDRLHVASDDHVWVRHLDPDGFARRAWGSYGSPHPSVWSVFDADGRWLGEVETPARFSVFTITDREVLGVWRDDDDVQYVHVYALMKP